MSTTQATGEQQLREKIACYTRAWNEHHLDAIIAMHSGRRRSRSPT